MFEKLLSELFVKAKGIMAKKIQLCLINVCHDDENCSSLSAGMRVSTQTNSGYNIARSTITLFQNIGRVTNVDIK